ncbi:hypothetical protein SAMN06273572_102398 [Monaibacterium marinum]|uniref:Uncharacterized protein n=1 Tax=Pontivivens marinum TaxID=1690039 RepID=A0A2C9CR69_9RHOB|nr:antifreeze protein [Monaibacterium marinum]SOH93720.1 hypothetical protein SAMN06273572_102398 [Monaibacterium marinum]
MSYDAFDPWGYARLARLQHKISVTAAQTIVSRSTLFFQGALTPIEATQMWVEKPVAIAEGLQDAVLAMAKGQSPSEMMEAALKPVAAKTSANAKRLSR